MGSKLNKAAVTCKSARKANPGQIPLIETGRICSKKLSAIATNRFESGPASDIDLLVSMAEDRSILDLSALRLELQDLLGVQVDVVSEDGLYWLLRRRILKEARPL